MHHEAINFYADDELAIMREERINLLYAARRGSISVAQADLKADVSLIEGELKARTAELKRLRRLAADEADDCPQHLRALEMEAA